jgi:hypothetical protein
MKPHVQGKCKALLRLSNIKSEIYGSGVHAAVEPRIIRFYENIRLKNGECHRRLIMAQKRYWFGMNALLVVFMMVLMGCPNEEDPESDTWAQVTDVNELVGTWKGSETVPVPAQSIPRGEEEEDTQEEAGSSISMPATSVEVEMAFSYVADASNADVSMKMNMSSFYDAMATAINADPEVKAAMIVSLTILQIPVNTSGTITKDNLWDMMSGENSESVKYYQDTTVSVPVREILTDENVAVYVNQQGTKIKLVMKEVAVAWYQLEQEVEFILNKQ